MFIFTELKMADQVNEFKLKNPPADGISAVKFGPNSNQFLLVSSWDTTVRLYDVVSNSMRMMYNHSSPVLDCCFHVRIGFYLCLNYIHI